MRVTLSTNIDVALAARLEAKLAAAAINVSDYISNLIKEDIEK